MLKSSIQSMFSDQMFKEELTIILLKLFQKIGEKGTLHYSVWGQCYSDMYKPDKDHNKTTDQYPLWRYMEKSSTKYSHIESRSIQHNYKPRPSEINPSNTKLVQHVKINE